MKAKRIGVKVLDMPAGPAAHLDEPAAAAEVAQSDNGCCHDIVTP